MRDQVIQNILSRRTIKPEQCKVESIEDTDIWDILKCANWAPTHAYTEPWRFVVFSGAGKKKFSEDHANMYKEHEHRKKFKQEKYNRLLNRATQTSHIIAVVCKKGSNEKIPFIEEIEATAMVVQNMQLAAAAMSYAAFFYSGGMTYHEAMREYLGFEEEDQVLGFLYLGIPMDDINAPAVRQSKVDEKLEWISN